MNAVESQATVEVIVPPAQFASAEATPTASTRDQAVGKDQSEEKKKPWYKRIKLQPVIYRGKCGI